MATRSRFQVARLTESGPRPRRLLVVADQAAIAAVPGRPAEDLPSALLAGAPRAERRGMDLDLLWDMLPALRAIGGASSSWRLWRYDAVVVVVDLAVPSLQTRRLQQLLQAALGDLADAGRLVAVLGSPPAVGQTSSRRLRRMQELLRGIDDRIPVVHAVMTDGVLADPRGVADAVLAQLDPVDGVVAAAVSRRAQPQDESLRQVAVDRSLRAAEGGTTDLQRAVMLACNSFDVPYAQINLVSRGRLRSLAFIGRSSDGLTDTLSGLAVQGDGPMLVPDTRADGRFAAIPETRGADAIRFYAGHPIESLDGYRIGVLCVLDTVPHEVLEGDDVLLRDVAVLAEAELNALTVAGPPSGRRRSSDVVDG